MVIDVRIVPEGRSVIERSTSLDAFKADLPPFSDPIRCRAELDRMGGTIIANLRFDGVFEVQCARCLEDYGEAVSGDLRVVIKESQGRHGQSFDDDGGVDFYFDVSHELVDISSAIYDEIMISLPIKPLCSEDCAGISVPGAAVGGGGGGGSVDGGGDDGVDPRWAALKKLRHSV
jgi:uncharacterized protein